MELDLLGFFQDRMARSYEEQVWAVALVGSMNGFIISQARNLLIALNPRILAWGIYLTALVALAFVWSRHGIFVYYDRLAKQIMADHSPIALPGLTGLEAVARLIVGWSGVALYTLLVIGMTYASLRVLRTYGRNKSA
jgi:hypothetical protein